MGRLLEVRGNSRAAGVRARVLGPVAIVIGLVGAIAVGWSLPGLPAFGVVLASRPEVGWATVPIGFAVIHAIAVAAGEGLLPRNHGPVRRAQLRQRNWTEYITAWARAWGVVGVALTIATLIVTLGIGWWFHGSMHDWFALRPEVGNGVPLGPLTLVGGVPGPPLVAPALMGILVVVFVDLFALRRIAARGAVGADRQTDERIRRMSSMRVVKSGLASVMSIEAALILLGGVMIVGVSHGGIGHWVGWFCVGTGFALMLLVAGLLIVPSCLGSSER